MHILLGKYLFILFRLMGKGSEVICKLNHQGSKLGPAQGKQEKLERDLF